MTTALQRLISRMAKEYFQQNVPLSGNQPRLTRVQDATNIVHEFHTTCSFKFCYHYNSSDGCDTIDETEVLKNANKTKQVPRYMLRALTIVAQQQQQQLFKRYSVHSILLTCEDEVLQSSHT